MQIETITCPTVLVTKAGTKWMYDISLNDTNQLDLAKNPEEHIFKKREGESRYWIAKINDTSFMCQSSWNFLRGETSNPHFKAH